MAIQTRVCKIKYTSFSYKCCIWGCKIAYLILKIHLGYMVYTICLVQSMFVDGTANSEVQQLVVTHPLVEDRFVNTQTLLW